MFLDLVKLIVLVYVDAVWHPSSYDSVHSIKYVVHFVREMMGQNSFWQIGLLPSVPMSDSHFHLSPISSTISAYSHSLSQLQSQSSNILIFYPVSVPDQSKFPTGLSHRSDWISTQSPRSVSISIQYQCPLGDQSKLCSSLCPKSA